MTNNGGGELTGYFNNTVEVFHSANCKSAGRT